MGTRSARTKIERDRAVRTKGTPSPVALIRIAQLSLMNSSAQFVMVHLTNTAIMETEVSHHRFVEHLRRMLECELAVVKDVDPEGRAERSYEAARSIDKVSDD